MKKYLSLLLILLSGCSKNGNQEETMDDKYPSVILAINPSIKLYYDEDYNVVNYEYLNQDGQDAWSENDITGKNILSVLEELIIVAKEKEYLNYDNKNVQITLMQEDITLHNTVDEMITEYVVNSKISIVVSIQQADENNNVVVLSTTEKDVDALTIENITGIWVSEEWINPSIKLEYYNPNYTRTLVFMEDNTGIEGLYVSENGVNFAGVERTFYTPFSWTYDGYIKTNWTEKEWIAGYSEYKSLFDDLMVLDEAGDYNYATAYKYEIKKGKLYQYLSENEYVVFHKVDSFEEPYVGNWFDSTTSQKINSMDYTNPKATYDILMASYSFSWDGTVYRKGLSNSEYTKDGNVYHWIEKY